jgi:hypothetical protein
MNEYESKEKNEIGEDLSWCPRCSSHTQTTERDSKDVCAVCYEDSVFTPANTKLAYIGLGIAAVFFFLAASSWGKYSVFISFILAGFTFRYYLRYRKWADWAADERRKERKKERTAALKRRNGKSQRAQKSVVPKEREPSPAEPPDDIRKDRTDPAPKPPPPPPDFDD